MELLQQLKQPTREFTPIPFWFLNGDLQEEELERQLKDFASHGVDGDVLPRLSHRQILTDTSLHHKVLLSSQVLLLSLQ